MWSSVTPPRLVVPRSRPQARSETLADPVPPVARRQIIAIMANLSPHSQTATPFSRTYTGKVHGA